MASKPDTRPVARGGSARLWATAALAGAGAAGLTAALLALRPALPTLLHPSDTWSPDYPSMGSAIRTLLAQMTEPTYFFVEIAGLAMILAAGLAHRAHRAGTRHGGFPVAYGTGLWPWLLASAVLGLIAGNLAWGWTGGVTGVAPPLFVAFVSLPPAMVLVYGPGWPVALTGAALSAVTVTPLAVLAVATVSGPLGLPAVVGATAGMSLGCVAGFAVCRVLPWLRRPEPEPEVAGDPRGAEAPRQGPLWVLRRILADFSEAQFYGNEWAGAALVAGVVLVYLLNPALPVYGTGLLPQVLAAQVLTLAIGAVLWRGRWAAGWYPTFVPAVSVAPASVLAYGGSVPSIVLAAALGALIGPPVAAAISRRLPPDFHPVIGNTAAMALGTAVVVPALGFLPGVAA